MKVRITYTAEVSDEERRAIRAHYGEDGLATREEVKNFFEDFGSGNCVLDDFVAELAYREGTNESPQ